MARQRKNWGGPRTFSTRLRVGCQKYLCIQGGGHEHFYHLRTFHTTHTTPHTGRNCWQLLSYIIYMHGTSSDNRLDFTCLLWGFWYNFCLCPNPQVLSCPVSPLGCHMDYDGDNKVCIWEVNYPRLGDVYNGKCFLYGDHLTIGCPSGMEYQAQYHN